MPRSLFQTGGNVEAIRAFNRFYTQRMGFTSQLLSDGFCLTEVRILSEIYRNKSTTAVNICKEAGIDAGYLSRMINRLERKGLIKRKPSKLDARVRELSLSAEGERVYTTIAKKIESTIAEMLAALTADEQRRLLDAMDEIQRLLKIA